MQKSSNSYGLQGLTVPMFTLVRETMQGENHQRQEFRMLALFLSFIHRYLAQDVCMRIMIKH